MPIELKMPALSPTMEEGTLAKWLVKEGDAVKSGDILAEIETDKATMEFEAVDEGTIAKIVVPEGSDGVKVGTVIALIAGEGEDASAAKAAPRPPPPREPAPRLRRAGAEAPDSPRPRPRPAPRAETRRDRRPGQGEPAGPPPRRGAGDRPCRACRLRPRRADRQGRRRRRRRQGPPPAPAKPCRRARAVPSIDDRDPARDRQALQHAQDDRAAPHRGQADDPAHLPDRRHPPGRAAQAARRTEQGPREPRHQAFASTTC